jgi:hypothetical protein
MHLNRDSGVTDRERDRLLRPAHAPLRKLSLAQNSVAASPRIQVLEEFCFWFILFDMRGTIRVEKHFGAYLFETSWAQPVVPV